MQVSSLPDDMESFVTDADGVACNGGGGPLGHPKVYLSLVPLGHVTCPYCSRFYHWPHPVAAG